MDGIAIAGRDWEAGVRAFEIAGTQGAGGPSSRSAVPRAASSHDRRDAAPRRGTVVPVERIARNAGRPR